MAIPFGFKFDPSSSHNIMPDSFFAGSKSRKRKRSTSGNEEAPVGARVSKKFVRKGTVQNAGKPAKVNGAATKRKSKSADEELESEQSNEEGVEIDDMDLRHGLDSGLEGSGEEDEDETPAEKRLRLAQLYLDSVKESLGAFYTLLFSNEFILLIVELLADGEYDAAEIDKELISARLKQDVMEHSGKVHLFVADNVGGFYIIGRVFVDALCLV